MTIIIHSFSFYSRYRLFWKRCWNEERRATANYRAVWCAAGANIEPETGYLFGGLYTNILNNPVTQAKVSHVLSRLHYLFMFNHMQKSLMKCLNWEKG